MSGEGYASRIDAEVAFYAESQEAYALPASCHYWGEHYAGPLLRELGIEGLEVLWDEQVAAACRRRAPERARLVSLGAGDGTTELGIAGRLAADGVTNLELTLLELNPLLLDRARSQAGRLGLGERVRATEADLNSWEPEAGVDVYFAHQSLHHVVELEHLIGAVRRSLADGGVLLVNDMIGGNGHRLWPQAAAIFHRIWQASPERYRFNHLTKSVDLSYPDLDCSLHGFEGIRAQDILPLLLEHLHPEVYVPFGCIIDPFINWIYGPNLDLDREEDTAFLDRVARLDDALVDLGLAPPTHLIATFRAAPVACRYPGGRSPERTLAARELPAPGRSPEPGRELPAPGRSPEPGRLGRELPAPPPVPNVAPPPASPGEDATEAQRWRERYGELRNRRAVRLALALAAWRHGDWRSGLRGLRAGDR